MLWLSVVVWWLASGEVGSVVVGGGSILMVPF